MSDSKSIFNDNPDIEISEVLQKIVTMILKLMKILLLMIQVLTPTLKLEVGMSFPTWKLAFDHIK